MTDSTEYETEKEGYSTNGGLRSAPVRSRVKQSNNSIELTDLVNDATLAKSNVTYVIDAPDTNHYGTQFVQLPISNDEKNYQIRLMSTPETHNTYYANNENDSSMKYETMIMIMMLIFVVIVAILLTMIINTTEKNATQDDILVYNLTANSINNDPLLRQFRYMPTI